MTARIIQLRKNGGRSGTQPNSSRTVLLLLNHIPGHFALQQPNTSGAWHQTILTTYHLIFTLSNLEPRVYNWMGLLTVLQT